MERFLKKIIFMITILLMFYPLVTLIIGEVRPHGFFSKIKNAKGAHGFMWTRLREANTTKDIDVLILGSSMAYRGIDTRGFDTLGIRAFNFGSSAQTPIQTKYLLGKYLHQMAPSLIIWDVTPFTLGNSGYESYVDLVSNEGIDLELFKMIQELGNYEAIHSFTYVGMKQLFSDYFSYVESPMNKSGKYIKGGFVENEFAQNNSVSKFNSKPINLEENQKMALNKSIEIIKSLNGNKTKLVLVFSPINPKVYRSISNLGEIENYFNGIKNETGLIDYYNFNEIEIEGLDPIRHFYDNHHLNQKGVELYNKKLIVKLNLN